MKIRSYKLLTIFFVCLLLGLAMVSGAWAWRQERLRQDLVAAGEQKDTLAALHLLDQGADANSTEADKTMPDWVTLLKRLFHKSPSSSSHPTVLTLAAHTPDCILMTALIQHGANVNCRDPDCAHSTPLFRIMDRRNFSGDCEYDLTFEKDKAARIAVANLLLDRGADPNLRGRENATPLDNASYLGDANLVRHLLDCRAEIHTQIYGWMPWHAVIYHDEAEVLKAFLDKGLAVNATERESIQGANEETLLDVAAHEGATDCVRLLLERRADVHRDKEGWTLLMYAASHDRRNCDLVPTARLLLHLWREVCLSPGRKQFHGFGNLG